METPSETPLETPLFGPGSVFTPLPDRRDCNRTGDFSPIKYFGGGGNWYANFSSLQHSKLRNKLDLH